MVDECYAVYDEVPVTAAKEHCCDACKETIRKGDTYYRIGIVFEGSAARVKRCARCQALHRHLRDLSDGDTWPDEHL